MGAVISRLGAILRSVYLRVLGQPLLQYQSALDSSADSVSHTFGTLQSILNDFGLSYIPGAGHALGNLGKSVNDMKTVSDEFLDVALSSSFRIFVGLIVAIVGVAAIEVI